MGFAAETDDALEPFLPKPTDTKTKDESDAGDSNTPCGKQQRQHHVHGTQRRQPSSGIATKHVIFHLGLVGLYTVLSAVTIYALRHDPSLSGVRSYTPPAWLSDARLVPAPTMFYSEKTSAYAGSILNETVADAWSALLDGMDLRVSDDELILAGVRRSVKLSSTTSGNGGADDNNLNLVRLTVFDELECLRSLHEFVDRTSAGAGVLELDLQEAVVENRNCIERLRLSVMCSPDLTLNGLERDGVRSGLRVSTRARVRECVDWNGMVDSLGGRRVSKEESSAVEGFLL